MKNLILQDVNNYNSGVKAGRLVALNTLTESSFIATKNDVTEFSINDKQVSIYCSSSV